MGTLLGSGSLLGTGAFVAFALAGGFGFTGDRDGIGLSGILRAKAFFFAFSVPATVARSGSGLGSGLGDGLRFT